MVSDRVRRPYTIRNKRDRWRRKGLSEMNFLDIAKNTEASKTKQLWVSAPVLVNQNSEYVLQTDTLLTCEHVLK